MRLNGLFGKCIAGIFALLMIFTGCGKKGDPLPPRARLPAAIADLKASAVPEGIVLNWSLTGPTDGGGFRIIRSETAAGNACPGCPQDYRMLVTLAVADNRLGREGGGRFRYVDAAVAAGFFYSYRVAVRNNSGNYGEESNEAGVFRSLR